MMGYNILF